MRFFLTYAGPGFLLALSLLAGPVVAGAQEPREVPRHGSRTFGSTSTTSHTIQAFAFTGFSPDDSAKVNANEFGARFCTSDCVLEAAVALPAGALVTAIELEACDTSFSGSVSATLIRVDPLESNLFNLATASTGPVAFVPGCNFFLSPLAFPETINNYASTYQIEVSITGGISATTRFQAVRVFYNLQVSPPPATASFDDVPTSHPFFQFIEALRASGISTGCSASPPLYCPEALVTRGQMAAFLSRALGLHFVP